MNLRNILIVFAILLSASSLAPLLGYRYLALVAEYRQRNMVHLDHAHSALELIETAPVIFPRSAQIARDHVTTAQAQAEWCLDTLSEIEKRAVVALGGGTALDICRDDLASSEIAIAELDRILGGSDPDVAARQRTIAAVTQMHDHSLAFPAAITALETQLIGVLRLGHAALAGVLGLLFALVSLRFILLRRREMAIASEVVVAKNKIERQAQSDALTGLPNRRRLDSVLARAPQGSGTVLIRIDLDRFKQVNDILGHAAGDYVLCHVADILRNCVRPDDLPARVGGDEFVILCAPGTTMADAWKLSHRLLAEVLKPVSFEGKRCIYGASFGIAETIPGVMEPDELLTAADAALYKAKSEGRGTVEVFTSAMRRRQIKDRALADRFCDALEQGEIVPYFQTQHLSDDWSVGGIEILARWEHPTEGLLMPDRFLGIARQLGMEADIDRVIFDSAIATIEALETKGLRLPRVSFNVSAGRIMDPAFVIMARDRILRDRDRYAFEILESISYDDPRQGLEFSVDALKELGFQIDVDDFGSGHASINSVLRIEPHAVKIDRNIIAPIEESTRAEETLASILEFTRSLKVLVIAEGVDTLGKAEILRSLGYPMQQGFHFSRPAPLRDAAVHIAGLEAQFANQRVRGSRTG